MIDSIDAIIGNTISYLQSFGIFFGVIIIIIESLVPILPLGVFVAFNLIAYGSTIGFLISYLATIIGCLISYYLCRHLFSNFFEKKIVSNKRLSRVVFGIKDMKLSSLVLVMALPFSPAFLINIASGVSKVDFKKFFVSLIISKVSIIYFWGFIGKSLLESMLDFRTMITVLFMLLVSYVTSKAINKRLKIE